MTVTCCWLTLAHAEQNSLNVCIDYHCGQRQEVTLSQADWNNILRPFEQGSLNAQQERQKISRSIALFEQTVGLLAGTDADMQENEGEDVSGQLDCISESLNTDQYLHWLEKSGVLKWHTVEKRIKRTAYIFYAHWSAVIRENQTGDQYVVDSWYYKNGEPPLIQAVDDWLNGQAVNNLVVP